MKKDIIIGIITGLIANAIGIYCYVWLLAPDRNFEQTIVHAIENGYIGKIVAIGAILNLAAFFLFIKKNQDQRAKGVLLITILTGVATVVQKLF